MNRGFLFLASAFLGLIVIGGCHPPKYVTNDLDSGETVIDPGNQTMTTKAPDGTQITMSPDAVSEGTLGVPAYPGAVRGAFTLRTTGLANDRLSMKWTTRDSVEKVAAFYRSKLTNPTESNELNHNGKGIALHAFQPNNDEVRITVVRGSSRTHIGIHVTRYQKTLE